MNTLYGFSHIMHSQYTSSFYQRQHVNRCCPIESFFCRPSDCFLDHSLTRNTDHNRIPENVESIQVTKQAIIMFQSFSKSKSGIQNDIRDPVFNRFFGLFGKKIENIRDHRSEEHTSELQSR